MSDEPEAQNAFPAKRGVFATTHWSVVLAAGQRDSPHAADALEKLCRAYWFPLYAYVRRRGYDVPDAQDLTQAFFTRLIERNFISDLKPAGAKFRSFLLTALKNFLTHEWEKARAAKRGGGAVPIPLDEVDAESRYAHEPSDTATPDALFERRWAETVLDNALERLRQEQIAAGKQRLFDGLANCLTGAEHSQPHAELARQLGMTEAAIKMAVHRLRKRYAAFLRQEVAQTVSSPAEIDEELRCLLLAVAAR
jgi:RNA polymerase sigma-70 factor (ECF subfamily)